MEKTKCSICNKESEYLTIFVNSKTQKTDYVCSNCQGKDDFSKCSLEQINEFIAQVEVMIANMEETCTDPEVWNMDIPEELAKFGYTPKRLYTVALDQYTQMKIARMDILSKMPQKDLLLKDLEKAIKNEDFEKAIIIRKKIEELEAKEK